MSGLAEQRRINKKLDKVPDLVLRWLLYRLYMVSTYTCDLFYGGTRSLKFAVNKLTDLIPIISQELGFDSDYVEQLLKRLFISGNILIQRTPDVCLLIIKKEPRLEYINDDRTLENIIALLPIDYNFHTYSYLPKTVLSRLESLEQSCYSANHYSTFGPDLENLNEEFNVDYPDVENQLLSISGKNINIIDITTGEYYDSLAQCAKAFEVSTYYLKRLLVYHEIYYGHKFIVEGEDISKIVWRQPIIKFDVKSFITDPLDFYVNNNKKALEFNTGENETSDNDVIDFISGKRWKSASKAAADLEIPYQTLKRAVRSHSVIEGCKLYRAYENPNEIIWINHHIRKPRGLNTDRPHLRVMCIETGRIFDSAKEAAAAVNRTASNIRKACRGEREKSGGYSWKYIND